MMKLDVDQLLKLQQKGIGDKLTVNGESYVVSANQLLPNQEQHIELNGGQWVLIVDRKNVGVNLVKVYTCNFFGRKQTVHWPKKLLSIQ